MSRSYVNLDDLRQRAEQRLAHANAQQSGEQQSVEAGPDGLANQVRLVEELRVYQTELEIQNQELTAAQAELATSLTRYRNLYEQLPLPGVVIDERGFIVEANRSARALFGLSTAAALLGRSAFQLFASHGRETLYAVLRERHRTGPQVARGLTLIAGGEQHKVADVHVIHLEDEAEGKERTLLVLVDKTAEEQVREQDRRMRKIASHVPGFVYQFQQWPDGRSSIPFASEGIREVLGVLPEQVTASAVPIFDALHPEDLPRVLAAIEAAVATKSSWRQECRVVVPDGRTIWIEGEASFETLEDGSRLWHGYIHDITERVQIRADLEQYRDHLESLVTDRTLSLSIAKEAAETASRAQSAFLANMSHELRTPLSAIMGLTLLALRKATAPILVTWLRDIDKASKNLLLIINDILDISRIEADRLELEETDLNILHTVTTMVSLVQPRVAEKRLALEIDIPADLQQARLRGDPLRLGQILMNLVGNAVKFTHAGKVSVRVRRLQSDGPAVLLRFEVADSGIGISGADLARVFSPFQQADGSTTRKYGGTGLGLAICKRLVAMMGGDIGVDSELGVGSTFWFTVRLKEAPSLAELAPASPSLLSEIEVELAERHLGAMVLVVDDEPVRCDVVRLLLEGVGLVVDTAQDGETAVGMAARLRYDFIFMDLQLPYMSGTDAAKAIRRLPGYAATPIVALTANAYPEDRQAALEAGMNDHLRKPVGTEQLFAALLKGLSARQV